MNKNNLIQFFPNVARAYEVAKLGNFDLHIVFDLTCYPQGYADYKSIKEEFTDVAFSNNGLLVEIFKPKEVNFFDSLEKINERVLNAKQFPIPTKFENSAVNDLLKMVTDKLSLSISQKENVIKIASVIGQLALSNSIKIEHMAEAITYSMSLSDCISAEGINYFGDFIKIESGFSIEEAEDAIAFLRSKIKELSKSNISVNGNNNLILSDISPNSNITINERRL